MKFHLRTPLLTALALEIHAWGVTAKTHGPRCVVPYGAETGDDSSAIVKAFEDCKHGGTVVFQNATYNVGTIMQTMGLKDVNVELHGTLLWNTDLKYWLNNSFPLGYQNQSVAWSIGGENIDFDGFGTGTFDGNGQLWYDYANGASNLAGRPINLVINETTNSRFHDLRFVQSQFWTLALIRSSNIELDNVYINSTSNSSANTLNTDGADTFYCNNITFRNFVIDNGDDGLSAKANSSNIFYYDSVLYHGSGIAMGSIGQYPGEFEFIENVTAINITVIDTTWAAYLKTWTGVQQDVPPNGGGGGLGYAKNLVFKDFTLNGVRSIPAYLTQCISFEGATSDCDTSLFQFANVTWGPFTGNTSSNTLASFQCSAAAPCEGLELLDYNVKNLTGLITNDYQCNNTGSVSGFTCTGSVPPA